MSAEITLKFETPSELELWLEILKKYGLAEKIEIKTKKQKILTSKPTRDWFLAGSVSSNGVINTIPNLRDFAYESNDLIFQD